MGDEVVLVGGLCDRPVYAPDDASSDCEPGTYAGARYSLSADEWRPIALPDELGAVENGFNHAVGASADGRAIFLLGNRNRRPGSALDEPRPPGEGFWAYDPEADRWTSLPRPDVSVEGACQAGNTLVVVTSQGPGGEDVAVRPSEVFDGLDPDRDRAVSLRLLDRRSPTSPMRIRGGSSPPCWSRPSAWSRPVRRSRAGPPRGRRRSPSTSRSDSDGARGSNLRAFIGP